MNLIRDQQQYIKHLYSLIHQNNHQRQRRFRGFSRQYHLRQQLGQVRQRRQYHLRQQLGQVRQRRQQVRQRSQRRQIRQQRQQQNQQARKSTRHPSHPRRQGRQARRQRKQVHDGHKRILSKKESVQMQLHATLKRQKLQPKLMHGFHHHQHSQ